MRRVYCNWNYYFMFQVLITKQDVHDKYSLDNLRSTVEELISMNCVPIINENDVVASFPDLDLDLAGVSTCTVLVNAQGGNSMNLWVGICGWDSENLSLHVY